MITYPLVKASQDLSNIANQNPLLSQEPQKPPLPQRLEPLKAPSLPHKPLSPKLEKEDIWISSIFLITAVCFFFNIANEKSNSLYGVLAWTSIFTLIYRFFTCTNTNEKKETQYREDLANYPKVIKEWELKCISINREHNEEVKKQNEGYETLVTYYNESVLPEYEKKLAYFRLFLDTEEAKKEALNKRKEIMEIYISTHVSKSVEYKSIETPKKGVSEDDFVQYLKDIWDEDEFGRVEISTNRTIEGSKYLPDITLEYLVESQKFCIDIEIDEPYVGATGQPIHYIEGTDRIRDDFFVKNGWIVIRFAEEQVVNNPFLCYIYLLRLTTRLIQYYKRTWLDFESRPNIRHQLPKVARWTKDEAHAVAFKRYRNSYLKKSL